MPISKALTTKVGLVIHGDEPLHVRLGHLAFLLQASQARLVECSNAQKRLQIRSTVFSTCAPGIFMARQWPAACRAMSACRPMKPALPGEPQSLQAGGTAGTASTTAVLWLQPILKRSSQIREELP